MGERSSVDNKWLCVVWEGKEGKMTFGEELKKEFDYLCKSLTGNVREETLFNQLVKAFEKLWVYIFCHNRYDVVLRK